MFAHITKSLDFNAQALVLRGQRQQVIASNIANADTPGYQGRDFDFRSAMTQASTQTTSAHNGLAGADPAQSRHFALQPRTSSETDKALAYTTQTQPAMDGNSVDMDRERANFADNAVRYEAALRFINGQSRTLLSAIQGQ